MVGSISDASLLLQESSFLCINDWEFPAVRKRTERSSSRIVDRIDVSTLKRDGRINYINDD